MKYFLLLICAYSCSAWVDCKFRSGRQHGTIFSPLSSSLHAQETAPHQTLIPRQNPAADHMKCSLAGIPHSAVVSGISNLMPPEELDERTRTSRAHGYWSYIREGKEPPQDLVYGEFDLYFFAHVMDESRKHLRGRDNAQDGSWKDLNFVDIGSGVGRIVFAASALYPDFKLSRGIEILPGLHKRALECQARCADGLIAGNVATSKTLCFPMAPTSLHCGSFTDHDANLQDADCLFVFSTAMSSDLLALFSRTVRQQCRPGTIVITTDYTLPLSCCEVKGALEVVDQLEGWCWVTGGSGTCHVHRVQDL